MSKNRPPRRLVSPLEQALPVRLATDVIPPERFMRMHLDRDIASVDKVFLGATGLAATQVAADRARAATDSSPLVLLDFGCGTGNMLRTLGDKVATEVPATMGRLTLIGTSLHDYRTESMDPATTQAHEEGQIDYRLGGMERLADMPEGSVDVSLLCYSLMHVTDAPELIDEVMRVTKPGGQSFFNTSTKQAGWTAPFRMHLGDLRKQGYELSGHVSTINGSDPQYFGRLGKPV